MKIYFHKKDGVAIGFDASEINTAQATLRGLYNATQNDFIKQAIDDIEKEFAPEVPKLPHINYFHICQHCFRDLDSRDPNSYSMTTRDLKGKEDTKWIHYCCKPLKQNRPN